MASGSLRKEQRLPLSRIGRQRTLRHHGLMTPLQRLYLALADLVLVVHAAFVGFVVIGLLVIWIGGFRRWSFVRNFWFRLAHLAAIAVVAAESLAGFICPLTTWESCLRLLAGGEERYQGSFVQHWLHKMLFFELPERAFPIAYVVFLVVVVLSFWRVPPRRPNPRRPSRRILLPH